MAKAINWPKQFYDEVINEDSESTNIAIRLGTLYYDNGYYVDNEIIDIRVDHKVARKGQIIGEMSISKIKDIPENILAMYKKPLKDKHNVINFLSDNYNQPVNEETLVTIIKYKNLPLEQLMDIDDPHIN